MGACCGGRTRIGGGWMMTSGLALMKKVPPGTAISWKPMALRRSGTQFFCTSTLTGPSPHGAGKKQKCLKQPTLTWIGEIWFSCC